MNVTLYSLSKTGITIILQLTSSYLRKKRKKEKKRCQCHMETPNYFGIFDTYIFIKEKEKKMLHDFYVL
jgi:hypothetical protein